MKLIVGLGNPGEKYSSTRHNVGFRVVDEIAGGKSWVKSKSGLLEYVWVKSWGNVELIKPQTFMNKSGDAVGYTVKKHSELEMDDIWVVHDDLDIELGKFKIQLGKGPKMHNGVESVERVLGSKEFWRVRVGVENRQQISDSRYQIPGKEYVLSDFNEEEIGVVGEVIATIAKELAARLVV